MSHAANSRAMNTAREQARARPAKPSGPNSRRGRAPEEDLLLLSPFFVALFWHVLALDCTLFMAGCAVFLFPTSSRLACTRPPATIGDY